MINTRDTLIVRCYLQSKYFIYEGGGPMREYPKRRIPYGISISNYNYIVTTRKSFKRLKKLAPNYIYVVWVLLPTNRR